MADETFFFFLDAALTVPAPANVVATQKADGSSAPVQFHLWMGSLGSAGADTADRKLETETNPGVNTIDITISDASPGTGHAATEIKLALTQAGLAGATPGAALSLGTQITSSVANAVDFWVEVDDATGVVGSVVELSLLTPSLKESPV